MTDKQRVLQSFLDTNKLLMELFDRVEADEFRPCAADIVRVETIGRALLEVGQMMRLEYALSGDAGRDLMNRLTDDLRARRADREGRPRP